MTSNDLERLKKKVAKHGALIVRAMASGGGAVATDVIWDTKGDLAVADGADSAVKLAVGTDTHVLTADSTQATGIKWAASPAGITHGGVLEQDMIIKTADETVNNSTTFQDDDDFTFSIAANETWCFMLRFHYNTGTTPDIKFQWTYPSGCTISWTTQTGALKDETETFNTIGSGADYAQTLEGTIDNGATAGTITLQWAQNTQDASDTKILADSYMLIWRVA